MFRFIIFIAVLLTAQLGFAQNSIKISVLNAETKSPLSEAIIIIKNTDLKFSTDSNGNVELTNVPDGEQIIEVSKVDFETFELKLIFPTDQNLVKTISLKPLELGEVVISSTTRISREIDDIPTRVEAVSEEEVDEKANMRPSNVSMVLHESTGIQVQQNSASSATQSIRIQGLDGRYTQILKDGFPAFGGFSGSLSILEIPPLDLKQVEVIKGPSATFYGGGAIAGVVNFISKTPTEKPFTSMIFNQTSAFGTDYSFFRSENLNKKFGYTFLGSVNYQKEYDVDNDDFTELPRTKSFNLNPRFFVNVNDSTRFNIGNSTSFQNRKGGDIFVIRGLSDNFHNYFEENKSFRNISTFSLEKDFSNGQRLLAKQSFAFYKREILIPNSRFKGNQINSYTDLTYSKPIDKHALTFGFNSVFDQFKETTISINRRNETRTTFGGYIQDNFDISDKVSLEVGFRLDSVKDYGVFALPRVSILYKITDKLTTRFGIGFGYKTPSIFTEEAETLLFERVLPIRNTLKAEKSRGGTFDVNYKNTIGEKFSYSLNQLFFYTEIQNPLVLTENSVGNFVFSNAQKPIKSSGFETNIRLSYDFAKLFLGYTYTNAKATYLSGNQNLTLLPKNKLNSSFILEKHDNFKIGIEAFYSGRQFLRQRTLTQPYWEFGLFVEKTFGKFAVFANAENFTDTRQSRFGQVVFPPHQNPRFAEIYTHTEGRIFNGGLKIRF
jgi:iron complex outermembrane receptor protein/outer membrane receptor for ferrienterochelin and colicins